MRLLRIDGGGALNLTEDLPESKLPRYAILSHVWGPEEVTMENLENGSGKTMTGYAKIQFCRDQAIKDGIQHFWVDTCCIDKRNLSELSQALVSMFRWYANADKCYVFLSDVSSCKRTRAGSSDIWAPAFRKSKWFTRGWTLQELLAPKQVEFYARNGERLGDKDTLAQEIHEITGIPTKALAGTCLSEFSPQARMQWACHRETMLPEDKAYCLLGIFDVSMSIIYGETETKAFLRLKDEIAKAYRIQLEPIGRDVGTQAARIVGHSGDQLRVQAGNESLLRDRRKQCLSSLEFNRMGARQSEVSRAYSTTCQWVLKHPAYTDWLDVNKNHQHCDFLWINGKPGAGKSTLMKFAHSHAQKHKHADELVISFFFHARGEELEKSTVGLYRALLCQLFAQVEDLQSVLDDLQPIQIPSRHQEWDIGLLCELLSSAVSRLGKRPLKCFVDALDECDEQQIRDMVVFFEDLSREALEDGRQLNICFASRPYPAIDIRNGRRLTLENQLGHDADLVRYIERHLRIGRGGDVDEMREQVRRKANGIFMWTVLVVDILNKEFTRGRIFMVRKRLDEIPEKLSDLFKDILRRDSVNMGDLLLCLQWILFARTTSITRGILFRNAGRSRS